MEGAASDPEWLANHALAFIDDAVAGAPEKGNTWGLLLAARAALRAAIEEMQK